MGQNGRIIWAWIVKTLDRGGQIARIIECLVMMVHEVDENYLIKKWALGSFIKI